MSRATHHRVQDILTRDLLAFHRAWQLVGVDIQCRACGALQQIGEAGEAFAHDAPGCANQGDLARHPWAILHRALEPLPALQRAAVEKTQCGFDLPGPSSSHYDLG